jgi:hypothetical protein
MANIIFVGDSYCNSYQRRPGRLSREYQALTKEPTYLDFVADYFNLTIYNYGFGGQSWYYSRRTFLYDIAQSPEILDNADLIVFCHTNAARLNTTNGQCGNQLLPSMVTNLQPIKKYTIEELEISRALGMWQVYLVDLDFQNWAQNKWFEEIHTLFAGKKLIHFNCFPRVDKSLTEFEQLPGVVYRTPLIHITLGEIVGTDEEVESAGAWAESRLNHLNSTNNRALADVIIDAFTNYAPGCYDINLSKFEILNPNAGRWPSPGFGTQ